MTYGCPKTWSWCMCSNVAKQACPTSEIRSLENLLFVGKRLVFCNMYTDKNTFKNTNLTDNGGFDFWGGIGGTRLKVAWMICRQV